MENFKELNLDENIIKALDGLGYKKPSEIQEKVIGEFLKEKDIIGRAKTGSGKTAAFGIPLCELAKVEEKSVQGLVIVPTRELALQVKEELSAIGRYKKVRVSAIFGKQPYNEQIRELKQRVHIVVGTPGRILDHLERGTLVADKLKFLVVDECDKMLNMGFIKQIDEILSKLPKNKVTALFSATIPEEIEKICNKYMNNPENIVVERKEELRDIEESVINLGTANKEIALGKVIFGNNPEAAIVFCNTKNKVKEVAKFLKREGILVDEIHGDLEQKTRLAVMESLKNKEFKVLVATDLAARGIHIDHIDLVINYEIPMEQDSYVHRIGRTGRAGRKGKAVSFVGQYENKFLDSVEDYIGYKIEEGKIPTEEEIKEGKELFKESQKALKENKGKSTRKNTATDITKIHINGGKKKKIRALDIVGAFSNLKGLTGEDIGIIDVQDGFSYVDILNGKGNKILREFKEVTIKAKKVKISKAR
ncbi:MAG: DEAD/DEAH box helicase [Sarcina sp.]